MEDIFISYKTDNAGTNFAHRLYDYLKALGYRAYFNPESSQAATGEFPSRLKEKVMACKDFILIVSEECLNQLLRFQKIDWIREELLIAKENKKNIIPVLMPGVEFPDDVDELPEPLRFLATEERVFMPDIFDKAPIDLLKAKFRSDAENLYEFGKIFNSNPSYNVQTDFKETLEKAKQGDIEAQYEVAIMYYFGFSSNTEERGEVNYLAASKWFEKVADSDHELSSYAKTMLAKMYFAGIHPRESQSFEKSLEYYTESNDPYAKSKARFMLLKGIGCNFDYECLEEFAKEGLERRDSTLVAEIASVYASYGMFQKALELYETLEETSPEIQYQMGMLYKRGVHNTPPCPDFHTASTYLESAAKKNHVIANYEAGMLYYNPTGSFRKLKDFSKAKHYFTFAADHGHAESQYKLGWIYEYGLAGEADISSAIKYYEMAVENGHILASLQLAQLYQSPDFCNYQKAFFHAERAANAGCDFAQFILGNLYMFGRGCNADLNKAYKWYGKAHKLGIYPAKFMMEKIENILE